MNTSFGFRMNLFNLILELYFCQLLFFKRLINCEVIIHVTHRVVLRENLSYVECVVELSKKGELLTPGNRHRYRSGLKGDLCTATIVIKNLS